MSNGLVGRKNVAVWDERRNSSRVFSVPLEALNEAVAALSHLRRTNPKLVAWLEDGHPTLTQDEHWLRFGESYMKGRK